MARPSLYPRDPVDVPQLRDADYVREVLRRPDAATEADIEEELVARAAALGIELPAAERSDAQEPTTHARDSADAPDLQHGRTVSAGSNATVADSGMTSQNSHHAAALSPSALTEASLRRRSRSLSFSQYDKYLSQVDPALDQPKFLRPNEGKAERSAGVVIRSGTRKAVKGLTRSITTRLGRRGKRKHGPAANMPMPCICCREDFLSDNSALQTLPCGHMYCRDCLCVMIGQSTSDESKMPPRCCTQPIPSQIVKAVLPRDKQQLFLKAVVQYSTPWEVRIFCPNPACGDFIPPSGRADNPKWHPFEARCRACRTHVCVMCKRAAHPPGHDCPDDRELDAVLRMGDRAGWRRCYKCRALVELAHGCTHMTCRCKAQFCYICGAVWDPRVGCPNFCNGEAELERRRVEEEARVAEMEAEKRARERAAEAEEGRRRAAEERTAGSAEFGALRERLAAEMVRFRAYEGRAHEAMRARQSGRRLALVDKYADLMDKMRERHTRTEQHLEDRQVVAEIELRASLEEKEKKLRLKLKYMEDYCQGRSGGQQRLLQQQQRRQVTERDLEQLRRQYWERDGMERRHRSRINGLREKQAKSMEALVERHGREMEALADRRAEEMEDLAVGFANEEEVLVQTFAERKARLERRWALAAEILRVEMERACGKPFAPMPLPAWPGPGEVAEEDDDDDGGLAAAEVAANREPDRVSLVSFSFLSQLISPDAAA